MELARCLLFDHFDVTSEEDLPVSYPEFKADVVANYPQDKAFEIASEDIREWVRKVTRPSEPDLSDAEVIGEIWPMDILY